jgi:hypothetical protein
VNADEIQAIEPAFHGTYYGGFYTPLQPGTFINSRAASPLPARGLERNVFMMRTCSRCPFPMPACG